MGSLVFQATLGGQVNLNGPNTASTFDIAVPATTGTMVTTGDSGTVTNTMLAASAYNTPGTIGSGTANTGAFTTLSASSTVSGTGFSTYLASPPAIGGTAAAAGSFTTLAASSTVSGTGFSTYLASPPAIGGTAAAAGTFTTLSGTTSVTTPIVKSASSLTLQTNGTTTAVTVDTSQNVGIGTTTPVAQLGVSGVGQTTAAMSTSTGLGGTLYVRDGSGAAGNGGAVMFGATQGAFAAIKSLLVDGSNNTLGALAFSTRNASTDTTLTERMRIDYSGNVGIGTSSPSQKLQVANGNIYISTTNYLMWNSGGSYAIDSDASTRLSFYAGSATERMRISSTGNVGIGTTSPGRLFSLKGSDLWQKFEETNGAGRVWLVGTGTDTSLRFYDETANLERMRIDSSGNVGIGTTSPNTNAKTTIKQASGSIYQFQLEQSNATDGYGLRCSASDGDLTFSRYASSAYSETMRITASGNVGIGTTSPGYKLDVQSTASSGAPLLANFQAAGGDVQLYVQNGTVKTQITADNTSSASIVGSFSAHPLVIRTSNTERMRIDTSGNVGIGTSSPSASAILDAQSTTKGVRMPNMTTTQKNAISSPAAGLMVFDTTLAKLCVYSGSAWQTITSI